MLAAERAPLLLDGRRNTTIGEVHNANVRGQAREQMFLAGAHREMVGVVGKL